MKAEEITKGSTLLATLNDEKNFPCGSSNDLVKELHQMIDKALNHNSADVHIPYQKCPLCDGLGKTLADGFTSSCYDTCTVCKGVKIIPMYIVGCDPFDKGE